MWPAVGHITPTLKIAKQLRKSGHELCYLGLSSLESYVGSQGFEYITILKQFKNIDQLSNQTRLNPWPEIESVIEKARPDLLVFDEAFRDIAIRARESGRLCAMISTKLHERPFQLDGISREITSSDIPVLVLCPKELDYQLSWREKNRFYVEASIDLERKQPQTFPWGKIVERKPLIYCSFGSHSNQYPNCKDLMLEIVEAIKSRREWQLALTTGEQITLPINGQAQENIICLNWAPQIELLKKASIMITHGGLGSIKECIYFGVPMIVTPMKWDQPSNAVRVEQCGLGVRLDRAAFSKQRIIDLIDSLLNDDGMRARLNSMRNVFIKAEEYKGAAKLFEVMLKGDAVRSVDSATLRSGDDQ